MQEKENALAVRQEASVQSTSAGFSLKDIQGIGQIMHQSGFGGIRNVQQAVALCLIAHAEGIHPALAAMEYDIIEGRPSLKAATMLARFQQAGGKVEWGECSDESVTGTFSHPSGGSLTVTWDQDRVNTAGLNRGTHAKYPQQMKRARCISEGVRAVFPACARLHTPEENREIATEEAAEPKDITSEVEAPRPEAPEPEPVPEQPEPEEPKAEEPKPEPKKRKANPLSPKAIKANHEKSVADGGELADTKDIDTIVMGFDSLDIGVDKLVDWVGCPFEEWTAADVERLKASLVVASFKQLKVTQAELTKVVGKAADEWDADDRKALKQHWVDTKNKQAGE